jgi:hypothetical protein
VHLQVLVQGPDVRGDRHLVVVQDDDQVPIRVPCVVQRLVGQPAGHGAVADHGDHLEVLASQVTPGGDPYRGGDRGGRVPRAEDVVLALLALQEAGEAVPLADAGHLLTAAGEDLMRIRLVPDVPDELVARRLEHPVQRHRQLHRPQVGAEVRALVGADHVDDPLPHLGAQRGQLLGGQGADVRGKLDLVQKCHLALS